MTDYVLALLILLIDLSRLDWKYCVPVKFDIFCFSEPPCSGAKKGNEASETKIKK